MLKWIVSFFTAVCLLFVPINVQAEGSSQNKSVFDSVGKNNKNEGTEKKKSDETVQTSEGESTFFMIVKLVFMFAVVLGILFLVLRFIQKKSSSFQEGKNLQSLGGIGIGQNRSVQLIKTGNSILVVGVGDTITLLKEITDEEEMQNMLSQQPAVQSVSTLAGQWKTKWQERQTTEKADNTSSDQADSRFKDMLASLMTESKEKRKDMKKVLEEGKHHE
jgi:flagellar protein FliO/FliZ